MTRNVNLSGSERRAIFGALYQSMMKQAAIGGLQESPCISGPDATGVSTLTEFIKTEHALSDDLLDDFDDNAQYSFSVTAASTLNGGASIYEIYHRTRSLPNYLHSEPANIAWLCELKRPDCPYSSFTPQKHYHPPTTKCQLASCHEARQHDHCISQCSALPGRAGGCVLSNMPTRTYSCCYWDEQDRAGWVEAHQRRMTTSRQQEAMVKRLKILDPRHMDQEMQAQSTIDMGCYEPSPF